MGNVTKGVIAGLAGTVVLSVLMVMKGAMGLMPELDVIAMLGGMMKVPPAAAWAIHFMIGAVFGLMFAVSYRLIPGGSAVVKGMVFGTGAWLLMMVMVMPMAGAGMFGMKLGMMAPLMTWVLHLVFGAVMGLVFGRPPSAAAAHA